ncbi:MAG: cell division regulator GpsB [Bacilli bacterium]
MDEARIYLTPKDILEKDFKLDARGYRPQEVDKFLDLVIKDYSEFTTIIRRQMNDLRALEENNTKLRSEVRDLRSKMEMAGSSKGVTNVDILKRLGELEKIVYGEE